MDNAEITIIGAGAVGLAIAARLSKAGRNCVILEKNPKFGQEASSRNSEVIHSGIYYPPKSLKALLCVRGNALLYEFLAKHDINHKKTTKIIVAVNDPEIKELERLKKNGENNCVTGLKILSSKEVKELEPEVKAVAALFVPSTGIMDTHSLMQALLEQAKANGAMPSFNSEVTGLHKSSSGYLITTGNNEYEFESKIVINCAGLNSDTIASLAGIDPDKENYRIFPCKGSYFRTNQKLNISRLVYPVPSHDVHNLGIHLTLDLAGGIRFGPDAEYVGNLDYCVNELSKDKFYSSVKNYIPSLELPALFPDTSGIRPKIQGPGDPFRDFVIKEESDKGLPGFINLSGIESPGLTSCLAIGELVEKLIF